MTKATMMAAAMGLVLTVGGNAAWAQAQTPPERTMFLSLDVGAQPQQRTIETSSTFPLYDETAKINSSLSIYNGPLFAVTLGQRLRPHFGVAVGLSMFSGRKSDSTVLASIPDPVLFDRPKTIVQTVTGLKHTEQALHLQAVWFHPVGEKLEVVLSAGPTLFYVKQDLVASAGVTVQPGTQNITVTPDNQAHGALGFNAGFEGNYFLNPGLGVGLFVRYSGGSVDLPAAPNLTIGGLQAGLGARLRF